MKGVILAGGTGSRLHPLTRITNKHLLPVYDKPMICHAIEALRIISVEEIVLVVGGNYSGEFLRLLGDGRDYGVKIVYTYQENADGIAGALSLTRKFMQNEKKFVVMLGDNAFEWANNSAVVGFEKQQTGARLVLSLIENPDKLRQSGVVEFDPDFPFTSKIKTIIEKPLEPPSQFVVSGMYFYDQNVFEFIDNQAPSARGELEITDVNNMYIAQGLMEYSVAGGYWADFGSSIDEYYDAIELVRKCGINK